MGLPINCVIRGYLLVTKNAVKRQNLAVYPKQPFMLLEPQMRAHLRHHVEYCVAVVSSIFLLHDERSPTFLRYRMARADEAGGSDAERSMAHEPVFHVRWRRTESNAVSCAVRFRSFTCGSARPSYPRLKAISLSVFTVKEVDAAVVYEKWAMQARQLRLN